MIWYKTCPQGGPYLMAAVLLQIMLVLILVIFFASSINSATYVKIVNVVVVCFINMLHFINTLVFMWLKTFLFTQAFTEHMNADLTFHECLWSYDRMVLYKFYYSLSILMAIFQMDLGWLVPECLRSGFHWNRIMEVVVTTWAIRCAKLHPNCRRQQTNIQFFTCRMPFLSPDQQCQSTEWKIDKFDCYC